MNRKFLILVAAICGLVVIAALLVLPAFLWDTTDMQGNKTSEGARAVEHPTGGFVLALAWLAAGLVGLVFLNKTGILGMSEERHLALSFLANKMLVFFLLAWILAGAPRGSWGIGFWLAFLGGIVATFALFLTMNPALAKKIAEAAKADDEAAAAPEAQEKVEEKTDGE